MSRHELARVRPTPVRQAPARETVRYVREVTVRPIGIMEEAAMRRRRRTIEDTHPVFFIFLRILPHAFFLAAFLLLCRWAYVGITG